MMSKSYGEGNLTYIVQICYTTVCGRLFLYANKRLCQVKKTSYGNVGIMDILKRLPGENARLYASRVILDNIINLELPPGSAVSENELSVALEVSRTPIRESLIEMSHLGLVEILPKKGSFVTRINYDLIEDSQFVRVALETSVVQLICRQGLSDEYRNRLNQNLEQQKQINGMHGRQKEMLAVDNEFHSLLFQAVGKERPYEFLRQPMVHFDRLRVLSFQILSDKKADQTVNDHENLLYALTKRDAELATLLIELHLTRHQGGEKEAMMAARPEYFVL